ncbi:MAG: hypothetical protein ACRC9L_04370, partial [Brevinema sp.]
GQKRYEAIIITLPPSAPEGERTKTAVSLCEVRFVWSAVFDPILQGFYSSPRKAEKCSKNGNSKNLRSKAI